MWRSRRGVRPPPAPPATDRLALRDLAEHALSRTSGAPLLPGNAVRVLRNASENYPAWLAAIAGARRTVLLENYILADDATGRRFAEALAERARQGVRVRVLYDWIGGLGEGSRRLGRALAAQRVEVRSFNPPRFDRPFEVLSRDHRKALAVDGEVAYVAGLCVSDRWIADASRGAPEWRDTGVELRGPAAADVERAFAVTWRAAGGEVIPEEELADRDEIAPAGGVSVRVLPTAPSQAGVFRLDLLVSGLARRTLFLSDAYFLANSAYVEALRAASRDGVDVRLLVPGGSDLALVAAFSRAGYRPLLEAGVRIYEWNGPMMHAKTAVADGHWVRIGSSNLNLSSWIGNYELDVAIEDDDVAGEMELQFLEDLRGATEVVLRPGLGGARVVQAHRPAERWVKPQTGSATAGALRLGHVVGAALTGQRTVGPAEARVALGGGIALVLVSAAALLWPRLVTAPLALVGAWLGAALLLRAWRLARRHEGADAGPASAPPARSARANPGAPGAAGSGGGSGGHAAPRADARGDDARPPRAAG